MNGSPGIKTAGAYDAFGDGRCIIMTSRGSRRPAADDANAFWLLIVAQHRLRCASFLYYRGMALRSADRRRYFWRNRVVRILTIVAVASLASAVPATNALASSSGSGAGGGGAELHLVPLEEIRVPIVDGARADGILRLTLVLEASDAASAEALAAKLPVVRASTLAAALEFGRLYASPMMPVNAEQLAGDLQKALQREAGVQRVLVTQVAATRM